MFFQYDTAIKTKIETQFPNIIYARQEEALERSAIANNGKIHLPLLSYYADTIAFNKDLYNDAERLYGRKIKYSDNNILTYASTATFRIAYNMDIWAIKKESVDVLSSELFFFLMDKPDCPVYIPLLEKRFNFNLQVTDLTGNVEVADTEQYGRIYRYTLAFEFPEARIFRVHTDKAVLEVLADIEAKS